MKIHAFVRIPTRDLQAWLLIKRAKIRFRRGAHDRAAMAWWFLEVAHWFRRRRCVKTRCRHLLRRRETPARRKITQRHRPNPPSLSPNPWPQPHRPRTRNHPQLSRPRKRPRPSVATNSPRPLREFGFSVFKLVFAVS